MSLFGRVTYKGRVVTCECGAANWRLTLNNSKLVAWCTGFRRSHSSVCKRRYVVSVSCSGIISFINPNQEDQCHETTIVEDAVPVSWDGEDAAENASSDVAESVSRQTHAHVLGAPTRS